jgi:hypothetical protein
MVQYIYFYLSNVHSINEKSSSSAYSKYRGNLQENTILVFYKLRLRLQQLLNLFTPLYWPLMLSFLCSLFTSLGLCTHCNLACFLSSLIILSTLRRTVSYISSVHNYPRLPLAETVTFSLILPQAVSITTIVSKLSKGANLFEIST